MSTLNRKGKNNEDGSFNWKDAVADAAIMAGSTFFATLLGITAMGIEADPVTSLLAAGVAAGAEFFAILTVKRKLREKE